MNKIKVKIMKTLIIFSVSGLTSYIICKSLILFFKLMKDIDKLKMVIECII